MRVTNNMMLRNTTSNINNNKYSEQPEQSDVFTEKNLKTFRGSGCCHPRTSSEKQFK